MPKTTSTDIIYLQKKYGAQYGHQQTVTQSFNPNSYIGVTHLEHGCCGRRDKGHQIFNTACLGHISRQRYNVESCHCVP